MSRGLKSPPVVFSSVVQNEKVPLVDQWFFSNTNDMLLAVDAAVVEVGMIYYFTAEHWCQVP